jgi:hypothetical protein
VCSPKKGPSFTSFSSNSPPRNLDSERSCPALPRAAEAPAKSEFPGVWKRHTVTNIVSQGFKHGSTRHNSRHSPAQGRHKSRLEGRGTAWRVLRWCSNFNSSIVP